MSKKDYIALADFIVDHNSKVESGLRAGCSKFDVHHLCLLAEFLENQASNFNKGRWLGYVKGESGPSGGKIK